jgi:hypothetical protein
LSQETKDRRAKQVQTVADVMMPDGGERSIGDE